MYWANCSGTSLVQRIYLTQNQLYYAGYSGSMEERVEFTFTLLQLKSYRVGKRAIRIRGQFTKKTKDAYGTYQKREFHQNVMASLEPFHWNRNGLCWNFYEIKQRRFISRILPAYTKK